MIKRSEQVLLRKLVDEYKSKQPLKNVREGLGSIAYVEGNPLTKTEITLVVTLRYWDIINNLPVLPAALPVNLQGRLPVWLFSLTDYFGGFNRIENLVQPSPAWVRLPNAVPMSGIMGVTTAGLMQFPAVFGDLVMFFNEAFPVGLPQYVACITVHCNNVAYGTFLNSFASDLITISVLRYVVALADINQFINPLVFGYQTLFGKVFTDSIDPRMYVKPADFQEQISDIPINLPIDKAVLLGTYMNFDVPMFSMVLFVQKVEPLTHKK